MEAKQDDINRASLLSKRLEELLRKKNMTQKELSELSGLNRSGINRTLNGKGNPTLLFFIALARAVGYNVTLEKIIVKRVFKRWADPEVVEVAVKPLIRPKYVKRKTAGASKKAKPRSKK